MRVILEAVLVIILGGSTAVAIYWAWITLDKKNNRANETRPIHEVIWLVAIWVGAAWLWNKFFEFIK
jgi:hypothetical protein